MTSSLTDGLRLGRGSSDDPAFVFIKTLNWVNCGHLCAVRLKDPSYHIICGFFYVVLVFCLQANWKTPQSLCVHQSFMQPCPKKQYQKIVLILAIHARRQVHFFMMAELTLVLHKRGRNEGRGEDRVRLHEEVLERGLQGRESLGAEERLFFRSLQITPSV